MTIKDIAKYCGVSVSTVSRVINERPDVSPAVRERVLGAIDKLNFIPSDSARVLVRSSSDAIGLVVRGVGNPFYTDVIKAIERGIDAAGLTMVMQQIDVCEDEVRAGAQMERDKRLRGLIFLGGRSDYTPGELYAVTVPFVCCSYTNSFGSLPGGSYSSVSIEDAAVARTAVEKLIALGHRRIAALVSGKNDRSISALRYLGYTEALRAHGIELDESIVSEAGNFEMDDAYAATKALLERNDDFTALFAISDAMAIAAVKALSEFGRAVPRDCSVIAIDGLKLSEYTVPTLTTYRQPSREMGAESVAILLDMIALGGCRSVVMQAELREGASVCPREI